MANAYYAHYSDNLSLSVTPTINAGTIISGFPLTNLYNLTPGKPAKFAESSGVRIVWDFTSARNVPLWALFNHSLASSAVVKIQANATNVWTAPSVNFAANVDAGWGDGMTPNMWWNLSTYGSYRYWAFYVQTNDVAVALGELWLSDVIREFPVNVQWGLETRYRRKTITHETDYGVKLKYNMGVTTRQIRATLNTSDAGWNAFEAWWRNCRGSARPSLFITDPDSSDPWLVRFSDDEIGDKWNSFEDHDAEVLLEEVSSGIQVR